MMRGKFIFCFVIFFAVCSSVLSAKESVIVVFDFYNVRGRESMVGTKLSLLVFAQLSLKDNIKMVEREELDKIMKERKLNRSALVRRNYMQIAALVNADYIITGRIFDAEGDRIINLKLTKCSDGHIKGKSFFPNLKKKDYLEKTAKLAAAFVVKSLKNKKSGQKEK